MTVNPAPANVTLTVTWEPVNSGPFVHPEFMSFHDILVDVHEFMPKFIGHEM